MEYPSPKPNPKFESVEAKARYYADAFDQAFNEMTRCQETLIEIRKIAQAWMGPRARQGAQSRAQFGHIFALADRVIEFSDVPESVEQGD